MCANIYLTLTLWFVLVSSCLVQEIVGHTTTTTTTSTRRPVIKRNRKVGEVSEQKCNEYKIYACTYTRIKSSAPTPPPVPKHSSRAVGGCPAKPREFPHMTHLGYGPDEDIQWQCAGTLLSDQFVMTAAHCLHHRSYGDVKHVRLGDLNISSDMDDARPQQLKVQQIIKHPDYRYPSHYNDIALLKLSSSANIDSYVRPACLPRQLEISAKDVIAIGWGKTQFGGENSDHLQKVVLEMFSTESCNSSYALQIGKKLSRGIVEESQLCAGSHTEEKDTCQGDSGGPLQIYNNETDMYEVIGITSFGKGCGTVNIPGVYTRVYRYLKWIENNVWS